jgi:regulator of cell morphogenesis and NO signaling
VTIDPQLSVNQLLRHRPAALPLLAAAGIDTCCGGGLPLAEAAGRAGVELTDLLRRLEAQTARDAAAVEARAGGCACGCGES